MPINLKTPESIVIDKVKIEKIEISPENKSITLHYSKGYIDSNNQFISKSLERAEFNEVNIPVDLYNSVKDFLYNLLDSTL